jgi:hypothetical protein
MQRPAKTPDHDQLRGISAALHQSFDSPDTPVGGHVGAQAADSDFAALLAQLNDPPTPYQRGT